ncbi:SHOCT domain-containing protein [Halosegnis longus]|uniref:SHOCT domain-containing protein n=1 Tax=Halosegnis longus TaxID=2216012 RepID=A0AAJ4R6R9_9EURY|nr:MULTISPECIES: SHOCT domain-containing protein [Halobacteriales]RNJ25305.1 SHOCT domain-containing protein [Salella cibi]
MGVVSNAREDIAGVTVFLILGLGMTALFLGVEWFWIVWVVGFAVVLPLVGILTDDEEEEGAETPEDPVDRLKRRYADGELTDEEFEHRLERLIETDDEATDSIERELNRERR